jgi:hypothetical protein
MSYAPTPFYEELKRLLPPKFPHLGIIERYIVARWISREKIDERKLTFDYRLKPYLKPTIRTLIKTPEEEKMVASLLGFRIDVIYEDDEVVRIIEVKDELNPSALGQVLVYTYLYMKEKPTHKRVESWVIAGLDNETLHEVYDAYNVKYYIAFTEGEYISLLNFLRKT